MGCNPHHTVPYPSFKHLCHLHLRVGENPSEIQTEWIELMATWRLQV